jgi:hypothetical protein
MTRKTPTIGDQLNPLRSARGLRNICPEELLHSATECVYSFRLLRSMIASRSSGRFMKRIVVLLFLALSLCTVGGSAAPAPAKQDTQRTTAGRADVKVWVNTKSGVYHCPGTRWYGNTKSGEYMTQKQAQEKGYRPAYGKVCE